MKKLKRKFDADRVAAGNSVFSDHIVPPGPTDSLRQDWSTLARFVALGALIMAVSSCDQRRPETPSSEVAAAGNRTAGGTAIPPNEITTKSGVIMVKISAGEFVMGSAQNSADEAPPHKVKLRAFLMDKFEVTQDMFVQAQMPNPSHWQDSSNKPVERVRWRDAKQYCNERSLLEGLKPCYNENSPDWDCDPSASGYRLPTEAEWEYACRAGTDGPYDFGAPDKLRQYAWFAGNADQKTHPVGQKKPNPWGLCDLYGNVSEWCEDVYDPSYYKISPGEDPRGPASAGKDVRRVIRGGNWKLSADACRATARQGERTGDTDACFSTDYCGFRCVRRATPD
jgi:formylglycine-generating enzyme